MRQPPLVNVATPSLAKLPLAFDPAGLQADVAALGGGEWAAHFNREYFDGDWSGVALRISDEQRTALAPAHGATHFADTGVLERCPHLRAALALFQCPLKTVRLLRLTAGSSILEHRDYDLGFDAGEVRLHIPVHTNPGVEFYLQDRRVVMHEGECWYLNLNLPHRVQNRGMADRIHLVIDCRLNDWLRGLILAHGITEVGAGTQSPFDRFRAMVLNDSSLRAQLQEVTDRKAFIARVIGLGAEHGCDFLPGDVDAALKAARRAWEERWVA